ncbi:MAG: hypothetical protein U9Q07_01930 [Planctomycetota bacterium]|nr:hypothetical protein [Planctomycetota bacterium]
MKISYNRSSTTTASMATLAQDLLFCALEQVLPSFNYAIISKGLFICNTLKLLSFQKLSIIEDAWHKWLWEKIHKKIGLTDLKFHDRCKTFGSVPAQNGISTAVTQELLEHSSPDMTNKVYANAASVLRHAVCQIPAADWL